MAPTKSVMSIFFVLPLLACVVSAQQTVFDITKYGAKPGADISQVLLSVWKQAGNLTTPSKIVIPPGTWKLTQVKLIGNKGPIELNLQGVIQAPADPNELPEKDGHWITINYVNQLEITGGGVFDGQGQVAWKKNDCHKNTKCAPLPLNLSLNFVNNTYIHDVTTKDSKNFHVNCISSRNVTFERFTVSAPGDSPNTDGIHLGRSSNVTIIDSIIETGDDCVSIGDESTEIRVQNVTCGPGHGVSIGSLGRYPDEKDVVGVYVQNCTFKGTLNGVRIKTWPSSPYSLQVKDVHFEDLIMQNVSNPIIIDQEYCPWNQCSKEKPSLIQISDVTIKNIKGSSFTQEAVSLICSSKYPCANVKITDIDISYKGPLGSTTTKCSNIKPAIAGNQNPPLCAGAAPTQAS